MGSWPLFYQAGEVKVLLCCDPCWLVVLNDEESVNRSWDRSVAGLVILY